jgi:competence protein ComEC
VAGDRGAISEADEEAMRRSGLAHLLSISGLHVTAVVGFAMLLTMRLLALSRRLALAGYVLPLAAAAGALAGGGYTLLAGQKCRHCVRSSPRCSCSSLSSWAARR